MRATPLWYIAIDGVAQGPMSEDDVRAKACAGQADSDALVFKVGTRDWQTIVAVPEFAPLFATAAEHPSPPPLPPAQPSPRATDSVPRPPRATDPAQRPTLTADPALRTPRATDPIFRSLQATDPVLRSPQATDPIGRKIRATDPARQSDRRAWRPRGTRWFGRIALALLLGAIGYGGGTIVSAIPNVPLGVATAGAVSGLLLGARMWGWTMTLLVVVGLGAAYTAYSPETLFCLHDATDADNPRLVAPPNAGICFAEKAPCLAEIADFASEYTSAGTLVCRDICDGTKLDCVIGRYWAH